MITNVLPRFFGPQCTSDNYSDIELKLQTTSLFSNHSHCEVYNRMRQKTMPLVSTSQKVPNISGGSVVTHLSIMASTTMTLLQTGDRILKTSQNLVKLQTTVSNTFPT